MKKLSLYVFLVLMWCNVGFAGCIEGNCVDGQGTFTWEDGRKYVGEFKDGLPHGQGILKYADGRVKKGIWENGQLPELKEAMKEEMLKKSITPTPGFDFICYNECKERNDDAFCRQKCSIQ